MIVYGDFLFIENFMIGVVLLYITSEIFNISLSSNVSRLRVVTGGILCGIFSMTVFLPVRMPITVLLEILFALCVCLVVFGHKKLWHKALVFILVTYFMGGLTMGLLFVTKNQGIYAASGIYTGDMKAGFLALFIGIGLFTAKQIIKTVSAKKFYEEHVFDVSIDIDGMIFNTKGFFDTGNQLFDPISGKPVAVAQESLWQRFEEAHVILPQRMGVVPYEAIGADGLMETLRVDDMRIAGRRLKGNIIAKGDKTFDLDGKAAAGCELLLSKYMSERKI